MPGPLLVVADIQVVFLKQKNLYPNEVYIVGEIHIIKKLIK